jgi:hypothetical protein
MKAGLIKRHKKNNDEMIVDETAAIQKSKGPNVSMSGVVLGLFFLRLSCFRSTDQGPVRRYRKKVAGDSKQSSLAASLLVGALEGEIGISGRDTIRDIDFLIRSCARCVHKDIVILIVMRSECIIPTVRSSQILKRLGLWISVEWL